MNPKAQSVFKLLLRNLSSKKLNPKFNFDVDVDVAKKIADGSFSLRRHPGIFNIKSVSLPEELTQAVEDVTKEYPRKNLLQDAKSFSQYIWSRHIPLEPDEIRWKKHEIENRIKMIYNIDPKSPGIPEEVRKQLEDSVNSRVHQSMKYEVYNWKAISYEPYRCALYLVGRLAPDFAALVRIMAEIEKRDPNFRPRTILDFGSGVGSSMWAVDHVWPTVCQEAVCVDSSADMNDMADKVLRGGDAKNPRLVRPGGTFFKQFLPLSRLLKYDLVISSRSLFELPNTATRLRTLDVLWRKTSGYLVLVEAGTFAGHRLIQEAKDFIIQQNTQDQGGESGLECYVFSPCPHDNYCPKLLTGRNIPCNFEISYKPVLTDSYHKERFSYVVLKRGKREESVENVWPRLIEDPLLCKKHVVCRTCTQFGTLRELTATKGKHSKECYRMVKYSRWGDLVPLQLPNIESEDVTDSESDSEECNEN